MSLQADVTPSIEARRGWMVLWRRAQGRWRSALRPASLYLHAGSAAGASWAGAQAAFERWCASHEGEVCTIGLSGRWLLTSVSSDGASEADARQQAVAQWTHYLDLDEGALQAEWLFRQVAVRQAGLVCATPRGLIDALQTQASSHGVRLERVGPWWAHGLQSWLASLPTLAAGGGEADVGGEADTDDVANGEAFDDAASLRTLQMVEPGLVTRAQAQCLQGQPPRLVRLWTEVAAAVPADVDADANGHTVSLLSPSEGDTLVMPAEACLWEHAAIAPVLQGRDACWQERG